MNARIPLAIVTLGCVVLFGAIAFLFTLVIVSMLNGGIDFPATPESADAAGLASLVLAA
jgi:hypothetical protein